ncbi:MAG: hypothetical protein GYB68_10155 [Chloroflexi bacterium]|nr:hypothetical protein [Chloroflexota bacterium]
MSHHQPQSDNVNEVTHHLRSLDPGLREQPNAQRAYRVMKHRIQRGTMLEQLKSSRRMQAALAGVVGVFVLVALFSLAPVRALASNFLGIFRVESFVLVDVDPERMEEIAAAFEDNFFFFDTDLMVLF